MTGTPRWFSDTKDGHSQWYVDRFRSLAADGVDLAGEARLVDALVPPGSRILDAGCGPGRVGAVLHDRGHTVVGVDVDPVLIAAAEQDHPGPTWITADLAALDLGILDPDLAPFDLAVLAGNVLVFVAPSSEREVLRRVAAQVVPGGRIITGFATDREYRVQHFDDDLAATGLQLIQRFATWDLEPFTADSGFMVSLIRVPGPVPTIDPVRVVTPTERSAR